MNLRLSDHQGESDAEDDASNHEHDDHVAELTHQAVFFRSREDTEETSDHRQEYDDSDC